MGLCTLSQKVIRVYTEVNFEIRSVYPFPGHALAIDGGSRRRWGIYLLAFE